MTQPLLAVSASTGTARISQADARRAIERVRGMTVEQALHALRFSPGHTCPSLERVLAAGLADVRARMPELTATDVVVVSGRVGDGEAVTRLRRHAHGDAYWLTTQTTRIEVELARGVSSGPGTEGSHE